MVAQETFGQRVREKRTEKGISLRTFARQVGISPTYASKIERGEFPPPVEDKIEVMAHILDEHSDELLALAQRIPSDLRAVLQAYPTEIVAFFRAAQGLSRREWQQMTDKIQRNGRK